MMNNVFVLCSKFIILETILNVDEQQNGLYDMQLSVTAMFHVWKKQVHRQPRLHCQVCDVVNDIHQPLQTWPQRFQGEHLA